MKDHAYATLFARHREQKERNFKTYTLQASKNKEKRKYASSMNGSHFKNRQKPSSKYLPPKLNVHIVPNVKKDKKMKKEGRRLTGVYPVGDDGVQKWWQRVPSVRIADGDGNARFFS